MLNIAPTGVYRRRKPWQCGGPEALAARRVPGRPARLSPRQRCSLVNRLLKGARACGFATDPWTCPGIARLIGECCGARYHVDHIPHLMAGLGFSRRKPR